MTQSASPPPIPAEERRPALPWIAIVFAVLGASAIAGGISVLVHGARCHMTSCEQPTGIAVGMLVWGVVAFLTCIRGRVGFIALIVVLVAPLALSWTNLWFFLLGLVVILGVVRSSKEQLAPYYRWHKEPAP
ncbi:MAG: tetraspanin family protein [Actinobacteria bacterium]|nr:MAG: tetraspanin family protein [Actinomycetota bacterium]